MAARKKSTNKSNHGTRTHESLLSMTPSSNMNAALIKPKFTPLPSSKFSTRFQTKGTRNPIKGDILMKPNVKNPAYKVHSTNPKVVRDPVDPRIRSQISQTELKLKQLDPRRDERSYNEAMKLLDKLNNDMRRSVPARALAEYDTYVRAKSTYDTEVSTKSRLLTTDTAQFNRDLGIRTVAVAKGAGGGAKGSNGSVGPNRVL